MAVGRGMPCSERGVHGQSECIAIAMSKALIGVDARFKSILAGFWLVGAHYMKKESKNIGRYSARVKPQF